MKNRAGFFTKSFVFLIVIVLFLTASGIFLYFQARTDIVTTLLSGEKNLTIQFMLRDEGALKFSQTFLYHPRTGKGALVDVPGNAGTIIETLNRVDRIDRVFESGKPDAYRRLVENLLGLEIPFYCVFSLEEIERFVDILGGVEVFIANSMETDSMGNKVLLPSGNVSLDGGKARLYLSYTDPEETEPDRIGRIQRFLQAMLKKMGETAAFLSHAGVSPFLRASVETNLDVRAFLSFCREIEKLDSDRLVFQRVLGNVRTVDNQELLFPHFEGQLLRQTIREITENLASSEVRSFTEMTVSVELQNGTQITGLARRTREIFQSFGFDVVSFSNAPETAEKTLVIGRRGNPDAAARAADIIRCTNITVETQEEDSTSAADVTIILGKDFDGRYCK
jgi:anionic cell wall polymer biosynthesis LytR-Cps2A-Psr (LCP) family protein